MRNRPEQHRAFRVSLAAALWLVTSARYAGKAQGASAATTEDTKREAHEAFDAAVRLFDTGQVAAAAAEFRRAYALMPHFSVLFNLGLSLVALGQSAEAADVLEHYIDEGGDRVPPERRTRVEAKLERLHRELAVVEVSLSPAGAALLIDGIPPVWPKGRHLHVTAGSHVLAAVLDGYQPTKRALELSPAKTMVVAMSLVAAAHVEQPKTANPPRPPLVPGRDATPPAPDRRSLLPWWLGGAGVALLAAAGVVYLVNGKRFDHWKQEDDRLADKGVWNAAAQKSNNDLLASIHTLDIVTVTLAAVGVASTTVAAALLIHQRERSWGVQLSATPRAGATMGVSVTW